MLKMNIFKQILDSYKEKEEILIALPKSDNLDINYKLLNNRSILMYACCNGDLNIVKELCSKGVNLDLIETAYNNTALFFAMGFKHFDIVKYLIHRGANIHHVNIDGENILFGAVHHNNIELVKLLCMKGINKDVCNKQGHYPIFSAIANQNYEIVKILIEYGASIEVKEKIYEDTPLLASMKSKEIAELLINSGANIHAENKIKDTPIHIAVLLNNLSIVKKLAEKGANLNKMNKQSNNPIIFAVGNGYIDIVKYLLHYKIDLQVVDICKATLLDICIFHDRYEIMKLLIQKDKSLMDIKNSHYDTPLAVAIQKNKIEYVELLLKSGANPSPDKSLEYSPIHLAFKNKNFKIVNLLIKYNIDMLHLLTCYIYFEKYEEMVFVINNNKYLINKKDNNNRTPLVNASFSNNLNMVKFLLENGAISNEDALYYAVYNQNYDMIELLAKYGAKYNNNILDMANKTFNRKIMMFFQNLNT
jgi:hypothetical protein